MEPEVRVDDDHVALVKVCLKLSLTHSGTLRWRSEVPSLGSGDLSLPGGKLQVGVKVQVGPVARTAHKYPHVAHPLQRGEEWRDLH